MGITDGPKDGTMGAGTKCFLTSRSARVAFYNSSSI